MNGKGSKRRAGDDAKAYRENYDRIFGKKQKEKEQEVKDGKRTDRIQ